MSKTIDVNLLSKEIMNALENYTDDISEEVEEVANKVGKDAVAELKQISPKRCKKTVLPRMEVKERQNKQK